MVFLGPGIPHRDSMRIGNSVFYLRYVFDIRDGYGRPGLDCRAIAAHRDGGWWRCGESGSQDGLQHCRLCFPNFHLFDVGEGLAMGEALPISLVGKLLIYGVLYSVFYLALAMASFNRREL